jgi:hypothetical protein
LNEIVNVRRGWVNVILLLGLLSAPVAACLVAEPYAIQRELLLLPFAVLIATVGVEHLAALRPRRPRLVAWGVLALIPIQFAFFYTDYFTTYQVRSAFGFGGNIRGALEDIIAREPRADVRPVYLGTGIKFVDLYWRLYLTKHRREDLLQRTVYFDEGTFDLQAVPGGSLVLASADGAAHGLTGSSALRTVRLIRNVDDTACCQVFEKVSVSKASS